MTTILDEIKKTMQMPEEIWDGRVFGPLSFVDPFEITFWFQEEKNSKVINGRMILKLEKIEYK